MDGLDSAWNAVRKSAWRLQEDDLRNLFAKDPRRFDRFSFRQGDLLIDFSREKLDLEAWEALLALASAADVETGREAMFAGDLINETERRAALHAALRAGSGDSILEVERDGVADIATERERFLNFAEAVREGTCASLSGAPFRDVVNIGIGGSDSGPALAVQALAPLCDGPRVHFVSNVDGSHLADVLKPLVPETTLVVVSSKTFTTAETRANARTARLWLAKELGEEAGSHMAAISTNRSAVLDFGIDWSRCFGYWDWVGGRFSLWSAVGLPLAIAAGASRFREFLSGARVMDQHFRQASLEENLPVLLALVSIWRRNAMGWPTAALIPYDQRLARLPAYVQQLEMESNGKRVRTDGSETVQSTAPVVWGEPGTNAQHSFFQLIHQGTDVVPVDFLLAARPREPFSEHHVQLTANALAQAAALAFGKTEAEVREEMRAAGHAAIEIDRLAPHRTFPGDRPSTTMVYRELDPATLGRLIALFEHKVFVEAGIWGINAFDQWGVELGKTLAARLLPAIRRDDLESDVDPSTAGLIRHVRALRRNP